MCQWMEIRQLILTVGVAVSALAMGCTGAPDGPKRNSISGTVTREGIPIDDGFIVFRSQGEGADISGSSPIVDGKYQLDATTGVPAGTYKVEITQKPLRDPDFVGPKHDAPELEDTRFKNEMPPNGWVKEAEVKDDQDSPIDFHIDE